MTVANKMSASEALAAMAAGALTSEELTQACLDRINAREDCVQAWSYLSPELALSQAVASDERRAAGQAGPLEGIPVGIKDIIDTKDMPTERGSQLSAGRRPGKDAHLVSLLRGAGAVILGKCVTTEFALSAPPKTRNPHDLGRTPGGSSSGSAASVADWMVPLAIGSQTGGSMLRPASYCGVFGFKPTFGSIGRTGMSYLSRPLDHPGIYARSISDIELVSGVLMQPDPGDCDMRENPGFSPNSDEARPPRLAFVRGPAWAEGDADMHHAVEGAAGALGDTSVTEVELPPLLEAGPDCHRTIMNATVSHNLWPYYMRDRDSLHPVTRERVERGMDVVARDYLAALDLADEMRAALSRFFTDFDAIITPAAPGQAPADLNRTGSAIFNGFWTLLGVPAVSIPVLAGADGAPIGLQVVGPQGEDGRTLWIAQWVQQQLSSLREYDQE